MWSPSYSSIERLYRIVIMIIELPSLEIINTDGFSFSSGYAFENVTQLIIESMHDNRSEM